jgi:hypothetical protein
MARYISHIKKNVKRNYVPMALIKHYAMRMYGGAKDTAPPFLSFAPDVSG